MAPIFTHLVNFLYILTFFSGISCLTLLFTLRDRGDRLFPEGYILLRRFILSLLLFLAVNFLMFYRDYFFPFRRAGVVMNVLLLFLFDLLLVVSSHQWIRLNGRAELDRWLVPLRVIACLYIAAWLAVYITDAISPEGNLDILRAFLAICADTVFCLILVECLLYGASARMKRGVTDGLYFVLVDISFSLYLLYMGGVDIYLALADIADLRRETADFYFLDPVIFLFLVVNIGTIVLALRRIRARGAVPAGDAGCPEGTVAPRTFEALGIDHGLTPRESEILDLLLQGMNNPQIAEDLSISIHTVKRHMNNIFRKLGVGNRYELILMAEKGGR